MIKKAIVLIAGYGVRCLPFSKAIPKTMLSVVYTPIIQLIVDELIKSDIKEILFVTSGNGNIVQNGFQPFFSDALHVHQLVRGREGAVFIPIGNDPACQHFTDAGQGLKRLRIRLIDVQGKGIFFGPGGFHGCVGAGLGGFGIHGFRKGDNYVAPGQIPAQEKAQGDSGEQGACQKQQIDWLFFQRNPPPALTAREKTAIMHTYYTRFFTAGQVRQGYLEGKI